MKSVLIFVLALFVSSCCGTKKAIGTQPKPNQKAAIFTKSPETNKTSKTIKNQDSVITPTKSEVLIATNEDIRSIKEDSTKLAFSQNVSKRALTEHQLWDELLEKYVSDNGNVDYDGFKKDRSELLGYVRLLQISYEKVNSQIDRPKDELLAYWINAYNALTIDLILRNYPLKSIKDIKDPWDQRLWQFGDKWMNLNDIEHKILRKMDEPRIHFAIVCASESCPKLKNEAFIASKLEAQLSNVTRAFLADTSKNEISENEIKLSKIFKWFKKDFEQNGSLIDFLNQYSEVKISNKAKKSFKDYNWNLNE
ncbi:DUF547 domain-containing protein [Winogradskyella flava]|uniref:DUF547 domain-containing protein n=1 Tax=Winogradskyella flava TaxID=1884876 RepID=A0A842INY7_9FLAO|nr:DUF547 domain-containing protein [Winogradskyella flava]MBC2844375.1 DUF547 domain-containing protein [Winogradskyella flava]